MTQQSAMSKSVLETSGIPRTDAHRGGGGGAGGGSVLLRAIRGAACAGLLALLACTTARAQDPAIPPFYQVYGGLFYPSQEGFRQSFGAPSDFLWGMGMGLPVSEDFLYIIADLSWFRAEAFIPGTPDTNAELSHRFIHAGLMNKYFVSPGLAVRIQGGVNYNSIERKVTPAGGEEQRNGLGRKIGYFGGIGVENVLAGGRMAVFADAVYDYRRSTDRSFFGDFGGVRIVAGLAAFWF